MPNLILLILMLNILAYFDAFNITSICIVYVSEIIQAKTLWLHKVTFSP